MHSRDRVLASETRFQMHSQFRCSKVRPKSAFLQTMYLGCDWKRIRLLEQNFVPERRRASLNRVKVIKMSRLTIDRSLILWPLHRSLGCCKTEGHEADCRTFLSLYRHIVKRGQLRCVQNCIRNCCVIQRDLSVCVNASELCWLHLIEIKQKDVIFTIDGLTHFSTHCRSDFIVTHPVSSVHLWLTVRTWDLKLLMLIISTFYEFLPKMEYDGKHLNSFDSASSSWATSVFSWSLGLEPGALYQLSQRHVSAAELTLSSLTLWWCALIIPLKMESAIYGSDPLIS